MTASRRQVDRRGDLWGSVGAWFSGRWWNDPARGYVREVKRRLKAADVADARFPRGLRSCPA